MTLFFRQLLPAIAAATLIAAGPAAAQNQAKPKRAANPIATVVTDKGTIRIKLYPEEAPNTVANFVMMTRK